MIEGVPGLIDKMRTGRNLETGAPVPQFRFQLMHDLRIKDVLHQVGITIHVGRGYIRVADQVEFP